MYGKPAMTCFKYQVYLYGSEAITDLNALIGVVTEPTLWVITLPPLQAALPPCVWQHNRHPLEENSSMIKLPYLCSEAEGKPVWLWNLHM